LLKYPFKLFAKIPHKILQLSSFSQVRDSARSIGRKCK